MLDYRDLIEQLNLNDNSEQSDKLVEVKHFSMNAADLELETEHKHYQSHVSPEEDRRGKYLRTEVQRNNQAIAMRERWQDPEFREKMAKGQRGAPHKLRGPYKPREIKPYKWSEEEKKSYSERNKGTILINNGTVCHRWKKELPIPEGFVRGKLPPSEETRKKCSSTMKRLWREYKERLESEQNGNTENL